MSSLSDNEITLFDPKRNWYSIRNFDNFKILEFVKWVTLEDTSQSGKKIYFTLWNGTCLLQIFKLLGDVPNHDLEDRRKTMLQY